MKFKIQAGAELDLLTKDELQATLKSWSQELTRGARFRRRSLIGQVSAAGELLIGGPDDGPAEGFVWALTRVAVSGIDPTTESVSVYVNDANPSSLVLPAVTRVDFPGDHGAVFTSGDHIVIAGDSLTPDAMVTVTVQVKEVPTLTAWSL